MDTDQPGSQARYASGQALEALKRDHRYVKLLFDRYLNTRDMEVKREAGSEIIRALQAHTDLEEAVFYPKVHEIDPQLVEHSEQEHHEARQLMDQLKGIDVTHPQCEQLMHQLSRAILDHVESEEQQLFPKVQQSSVDLDALGMEMQAYEANMLSAQARASGQPGMQR